jgi:hypothetical protein
MPVFRVGLVTRAGQRAAVRVEAPRESAVRARLESEGALVESVRRIPLTWWPLSMTRAPWLVFLFPVCCYGLYVSVVQGVRVGLDLGRAAVNRAAYERLAREGTAAVGTVSGERREAVRGVRQRVLEYRFRGPDGRDRRGVLAPGTGDVAAGRHDFRLLAADVAVGARLSVTVLVAEPSLHAPFPVDRAMFERLGELEREPPRQLAALVALGLLCSWLVLNYLVRMGSHYELSPSRPRILLIAAGENPLFEADDDGDQEEDEEDN